MFVGKCSASLRGPTKQPTQTSFLVILILKFKNNQKKNHFLSKFIENTGMIYKLYNFICSGKFGHTYAIVLSSPTRWTTVSCMLEHLLKVRSAATLMTHVFLHERKDGKIDSDFLLSIEVKNIITCPFSGLGLRNSVRF